MATILAAPLTVGAPWIPDAVSGSGAASTFQIFGHGIVIQGGLFQWNDVCDGCTVRITMTQGSVTHAADGALRDLDPGRYELRAFRGLFSFSQNAPGDFVFIVDGTADVVKLG